MGKKIRLDPESVSVESFDTAAAPEGTGTVYGNATKLATCVPTDCGCSGEWTCPGSVPGTCDGGSTCYGTCRTGQCACF